MSKIVKGVKKGIKKVGKFVKKHWKPIAMAAAVAFTGGLATVGFSGLSGAIASNGILGGIGSTMWAGATSMLGTLGIGAGAQGAAAAASGMTGANMFTGALGQGIGGMLGMGSAAAGTGAGGAAQAALNPAYAAMGMSPPNIAPAVAGVGNRMASAAPALLRGGGGGFGGGNLLPSLVGAAGQYFATRGEQEAAEPRALFGVDFENGNKAYQPWGSPSPATGTVPYSPVPLANPQGRRGHPPPLLDPDNPAFMNGGPYG